jgi:hypothetical protein
MPLWHCRWPNIHLGGGLGHSECGSKLCPHRPPAAAVRLSVPLPVVLSCGSNLTSNCQHPLAG